VITEVQRPYAVEGVRDSQGAINLTRNLKGKYCSKLYEWIEVTSNGLVFMCCPSWLPHPIGNILDNSIEEIWNGKIARKLRRQIFSGEWKYCNHIFCPVISSNTLPNIDENTPETTTAPLPRYINFSNDESCNLACPSCRVNKILFNQGKEYSKRKYINDILINKFLTQPTDRHFGIFVTGSGDPFASKIFRDMLQNINGAHFPNMIVSLQTNGVMFTPKMWQSIKKIHNNLKDCRISFDAGTKETYENKTRLNGNWDLLVDNCKFLDDKVNSYPNFQMNYDFVVQYDNYKEMKTYVDFCLQNFKNLNSINFGLVTDWGTWDKDMLEHKCIWKDTHSEHNDFLDCLNDPIFDHPNVVLGNLTDYRNKAQGIVQ